MDAKICDRCGKMWYDTERCDTFISSITMAKGDSLSDRIGTFDLCEECEKKLFDFLAMLPNHPLKNEKGDQQ